MFCSCRLARSIQFGFLFIIKECVISYQQSVTTSVDGLADKGDSGDGNDVRWLVYSMGALVAVTILGVIILFIVCIRMKYQERHHTNIYKWEIKHNIHGGRLRAMSDQDRTSEKATSSSVRLNNNMLNNSKLSHIYRLPNLEEGSSPSRSEPSADERVIPIIVEPEDDLSSVAGTVGSIFAEESPC